MSNVDVAWCPGCGHIAMHRILKIVLQEMKYEPNKVVFVSGIGQAAKLPQYTYGHMFNGLHGRSLPAAFAINACNPELKVIVDSGDGCSYGEGGNHFIHQILRNPDILNIVHNNMIYGLTKGQASPTTMKGMKTSVQVDGVINEPLNPLALAISQGATFVARLFVGDFEQSKEILKKALQHKGYALIDAFTPCVSFNKFNTYQWYKEHCYTLDKTYDPSDQKGAFAKALETEKYPLGILYHKPGKPVYWENTQVYTNNKDPLYKREVDLVKVQKLLDSKREL